MARIRTAPLSVLKGKLVRNSVGLMLNLAEGASRPTVDRLVMQVAMEDGAPKVILDKKHNECHRISNDEADVYAYVSKEYYDTNLKTSVNPDGFMLVDVIVMPSAKDVANSLLGGA